MDEAEQITSHFQCWQIQQQCHNRRYGHPNTGHRTPRFPMMSSSATKMVIIVVLFTLLLLLQMTAIEGRKTHRGSGRGGGGHERKKHHHHREDPPEPTILWDETIKEKIDGFINATMYCRNIVGLNLAIVTRKKVLYTNGYGCSDLPGCKPATAETLFSLASATKAFTITLLAQILKERGKTIDTPVRDLLGEDFYFWDGLRSSQVTVRDLAAHRTGIPNNNNMRMQDPMTREILAQKTRFLEPMGEFRNSHIYNNLMYGLISYISEKESGQPWEELLRERIFYPLGMNDTTFSHEVWYNISNVATSYLPYDKTHREVSPILHSYWGELGGSGSILSNAKDMANWLQLQLNRGEAACGEQIIDEDIIAMTQTPVVPIPISKLDRNWRKPRIPVTYDHHQYGLGWRIGHYRDSRQILHTGTSWGYGALVTLRPDEELGIYTSITGVDDGYTGRRLIHMFIMDLLLGEEFWFNSTTACSFPEPWGPPYRPRMYPGFFSRLVRERNVRPKLPKSKYAGVYGNFAYGNLTVLYNDTTNKLELHYGKYGRWLLHCKRGNDFAGEGYDIFWARELRSVLFRNSQGQKDSVDEVVISFDNRDPPVFQRGLKMTSAPPPPNPDYIGKPVVGKAPILRTIIGPVWLNLVMVLFLTFFLSSNGMACCIL